MLCRPVRLRPLSTSVVHQLRQRLLVDLMKAVGQLGIRIAAGGEAGTIRLSEGADQCVAVLAADLAVLVAVADVEAGLLHRS
jgi:hypothetical protein